MDYQLSFTGRMLVLLALAQVLLLALCFCLGLVLGRQQGAEPAAAASAVGGPSAAAPGGGGAIGAAPGAGGPAAPKAGR